LRGWLWVSMVFACAGQTSEPPSTPFMTPPLTSSTTHIRAHRRSLLECLQSTINQAADVPGPPCRSVTTLVSEATDLQGHRVRVDGILSNVGGRLIISDRNFSLSAGRLGKLVLNENDDCAGRVSALVEGTIQPLSDPFQKDGVDWELADVHPIRLFSSSDHNSCRDGT